MDESSRRTHAARLLRRPHLSGGQSPAGNEAARELEVTGDRSKGVTEASNGMEVGAI